MNNQQVKRYIRFFENLDRDSLPLTDSVFAVDARFRDPFNDVCGRAAIKQVFAHMFQTCEAPRFEVVECVGEHPLYYLHWRFTLGAPDARNTIDGVSRVRFDANDLVSEHSDYWDPAQQVYERIPLLGPLLRAVRKRLRAPQPTATTPPQTQPTTQR